MSWFKCWEAFLNGIVSEPPGPIDNSKLNDKSEEKVIGMSYYIEFYQSHSFISLLFLICVYLETDYVTVSEVQWDYLWRIYSGGPAVEISDLQVP